MTNSTNLHLVDELSKAGELLQSVEEVRHQPAVVGYLVALFNKLNRREEAEKILSESVQYWQSHASVGFGV